MSGMIWASHDSISSLDGDGTELSDVRNLSIAFSEEPSLSDGVADLVRSLEE